ncbi:MAG: photosynthetic complex assembly protein PuhC [Pseudomonadota bacterium]
MNPPSRRQPFQWLVLLVVLALGVSIWSSKDSESTYAGMLEDAAPALQERHVVFIDEADGTLLVVDVDTDRTIRRVPSEEEAFMRALVRAVERDRYAHSVEAGLPITISAREDGDLLLIDETTGLLYHLRAFGPTNLAAFARLLEEAESTDRDPVASSWPNSVALVPSASPARPR